VNFGNLPASVNQPFSAFPADFAALPAVAFVVPNMCSDMHDCSIATGDQWLRDHLDPYAQWAKTNNSLLIVTFDEDSGTQRNQIATVLVGEQIQPGSYAEPTTHYTILRTIEDAYGLPALGQAGRVKPLQTVWRKPGQR
jgi:acid phosphatase